MALRLCLVNPVVRGSRGEGFRCKKESFTSTIRTWFLLGEGGLQSGEFSG